MGKGLLKKSLLLVEKLSAELDVPIKLSSFESHFENIGPMGTLLNHIGTGY